MSKKDFIVEGNKMLHAKTGQQIGKKLKNGKWEGPHPWDDDTKCIADSPEGVRDLQKSEFNLFD